MAESSRVEELRKRYHENPRRFFAPLANEYRKTGLLDRALLLCEKHLAEQPGNMNGLIVYGQTLFESGRHADARAPFEAALELDPENLIALRHLGDIARLGEDHESARKWYQRVLEFDRRNDEVMDLLEQVGGTPREPLSGPSARPSMIRVAPSVSAVPPDAPDSMGGFIDLAGPDTPAAPPAAPPPASTAAPVLDAAFHSAKTVEVTPKSLASVKTKEIAPLRPRTPRSATPAPRSATPPPRRASLLDINFDFGEIGAAETPPSPPAAPLLGSEAAEYGFADSGHTGEPPARPAMDESLELSAEEHKLDLTIEHDMLELSSAPTRDAALFELPPEPVSLGSGGALLDIEGEEPVQTPRDSASLIELPPEPVSLGDVPRVAGLQAADYDVEVEPLADLESMDFAAPGERTTTPLPELESSEFDIPEDRASIPTMPGLVLPEYPVDTPEFIVDEPEFSVDVPAAASASAPANAPSNAPAPTFVTETMAELYLEQGFRAQAIEVYRQLIVQEPANDALKRKLAALEAEEAAEAGRQSMDFATPAEVPTVAVELPPANAMLSEVTFEDLALRTPASNVRVPAPVAAAPVPSGPTAREFFAAFARRAAAPTTPTASDGIAPSYAIPAALSPLDQLFGIEATDEDQRAANLLAAMGTTSAPTGSSSLDSLFTIGGSAPAPRPTVSRASEKLKFDQFFSASSSPAQDARPITPPVTEPATEAPAESPAADDDDLDQFQGWLKGLTQ